MQRAIPALLMRGGTSKGLYFLASDLPADETERDQLLLAAMGSPDARQIDGVGGAHPLTSKVAIISPSQHPEADVDYLFLQVSVTEALVSDAQNCGNILAGVGPFAIERGLVEACDGETAVRIHMVNTGALAVAHVSTLNGQVNYQGDCRIDGVPGSAAAIVLDFLDIAGSSCGSLLPTGNCIDVIDGVAVTCVDNGMPVVVLNARDFGITGSESPAELEANSELKARIESIRLQAGPMMNLGDVKNKTVPKMCLVSPPVSGGHINTRTFIPHRVHEAIGVLGAVSAATACLLPDSVAAPLLDRQVAEGDITLQVEHPTGFFTVALTLEGCGLLANLKIIRAALVRTARLLMRGEVMVPEITE
ncbi:4-oxalomesaconate tautomerase [Halioxenophilus sp. WMMB6]|uniref:4-oxalomesaconate tautomerase n=1 Tax=Halioxenophilus sp. WMMB6 TaxID=3073815 RepID=UPI00295F28C9|nr:4-oxalomesaconate tautomerase [Halioxenophilus sp. WMMB6]